MLPAHLKNVLKEGLAFQAKGRMGDAASRYARIREGAPKEFEGWHHGGIVALAAGQGGEAVTCLGRALELQPQSIDTALALGIAHLATSNLAAAEAVLSAVAKSRPKFVDAWRYLALVYETQGRIEQTCAAREQAVNLNPKFAPAWVDYGSTLSLAGRQTDALAAFARALGLDNGNVRARVGYAMVYLRCHRIPEAIVHLQEALRRNPADFLARSFYLMALNNLPDISREQLRKEHELFGQLAGPPITTSWPNSMDPNRRLRVAFLSRDFCDHSVGYFIEPLLRHLDRNDFELVVYSDNAKNDDVTARLRSHAALWRNIVGQADPAVEAAIRADRIDIVVDLAGHTASNRLPLLARRLAPVQVNYLGYPNTTGVRAIDYRFVDEITDPAPDADAFATEELIRFAPTAWSYAPLPDAPVESLLPASARGSITFGTFNNLAKVSDRVLKTWARILEAVPRARLLIKAAGLAEAAVSEPLRQRLAAAGFSADQVELLAHTSDTQSHLAVYSRVDIALDPFPYNGTTTTCEALWMGVPVVSLAGDRHASRVGLSLLKAIGHAEWVATNEDDYIGIATALAGDLVRLAEIRRVLRAEMRRSCLLDHAGQAERFGAALRACWLAACGPAVPVSTVLHPELAAHEL